MSPALAGRFFFFFFWQADSYPLDHQGSPDDRVLTEEDLSLLRTLQILLEHVWGRGWVVNPQKSQGQASICSFWESFGQVSFPCGSAGKEYPCSTGDLGSILGLGRSPGRGKGYPLQHSSLENSMDFIVHGVAKSRTQMSYFHFYFGQVRCILSQKL